MTSERLSSNALLSIARVRAKKAYSDGFIDEFDNRHDTVEVT